MGGVGKIVTVQLIKALSGTVQLATAQFTNKKLKKSENSIKFVSLADSSL